MLTLLLATLSLYACTPEAHERDDACAADPRGRAQDSRSLAGIITQAFSKRLWLGHLQLLYLLV